ncbi:hypothetical protein [Arenicella xantha]|uniref:Uncharacterized protein n=1 Tax=Arenicella xantha TaxID=644221 RepID=A0A395JIM0_9GAMM|nr:hypothetical protein [Arenicella xantha]RBP50626.1 hypothetical protein DFR28_10237 [Arenicella xantha]
MIVSIACGYNANTGNTQAAQNPSPFSNYDSPISHLNRRLAKLHQHRQAFDRLREPTILGANIHE